MPTSLEEFAKADAEQANTNRLLRGEIKRLEGANAELRKEIEALKDIDNIKVEPPKWVTRPNKKHTHSATPCLLLSDCHFDEVVNPDEIEGSNEYNREIALRRLKRTLSGTIDVARNYLKGLQYEGMVLMLGGDIFSGNIHEELVETNEDTILGSLDFWADHVAGVVSGLAVEFGNVMVAGVVGNHGRNTRKPRSKLRVRDNFDWLFYRILARTFKGDNRVSFILPESADCIVKVYDTTFRLTHGDQFRGGSGISGMLAPIMLGQHRKSRRQISMQRPFDWLVMGHWHQLFMGRGLIVNGTNKGYDEYAYTSNFDWERPQQAFWIVSPTQGVTISAPIFAEDERK